MASLCSRNSSIVGKGQRAACDSLMKQISPCEVILGCVYVFEGGSLGVIKHKGRVTALILGELQGQTWTGFISNPKHLGPSLF